MNRRRHTEHDIADSIQACINTAGVGMTRQAASADASIGPCLHHIATHQLFTIYINCKGCMPAPSMLKLKPPQAKPPCPPYEGQGAVVAPWTPTQPCTKQRPQTIRN
eukprot:5949547-Alexandrium_andersonii.AAC.1